MTSFLDLVGIGRKGKKKPFEHVRVPTLAEIFADRFCGTHNQDVVFLLTGPRGSGKSMALLSLAHSLALEVVKRRGGKPEDYFNENHIAIVDPEKLIEKMVNLKRYGIYVLDDASIAWNARNFASSQNKGLNDILTVCRTQNAAILISVPDSGQVDKWARELGSFYGEVSESYHSVGISFIKVFRNVKLYRQGKLMHPYISRNGAKIRRFIATMPPAHLLEMYDRVRGQQVHIQSLIQKEKLIVKHGPGKRQAHWNKLNSDYGPDIAGLRSSGHSPYAISNKLGIPESAVRRVASMQGCPFE